MAVLIGAALLLAQLVSFAYLIVQRQQFSRAQIDAPVITRFTSTAADFVQASPEFRPLVLKDASRRAARYELSSQSAVELSAKRRGDSEERVRESLSAAGISVRDVRAALEPRASRSQRDQRRPLQTFVLSAELPDGHWLNGRFRVRSQPPLVTPELVLGTLLLYLFVLGAALLIGRRLARPLRRLTSAAEAFRGRNEPVVVEPNGPADLRNAILAFNAMNERVVKLLEEKDRTLGAIGHDLRTPLASLRIRAESVEPEEERERMIKTIEEMASTLEDILVLARSGRSREQFETKDVSALVAEVAGEYRELGRPVTVSAGGTHILDVQPNLLRRAVRNLVDNALKYGGSAEAEVTGDQGAVRIGVLDRGPGLPPTELERVAGAFYRGEPSRNRETGGAGLGLAIAQAVADAHGGTLTFDNREGGGLAATITLPNEKGRPA
jgi:signal transduction histidine kinase